MDRLQAVSCVSNGAQNARSSAHHAIAGRAELFNVVDAGKRMRPADGNAVVAVLAVDDAGKAPVTAPIVSASPPD